MLFASTRRSMLTRSFTRNVRVSDAFSENCPGPVMVFRPALPHWPGAGAANAAALRNAPEEFVYKGAPVRFGRRLPVKPVPLTGARITGVSGIPLPMVSCDVSDHSLATLPFQ